MTDGPPTDLTSPRLGERVLRAPVAPQVLQPFAAPMLHAAVAALGVAGDAGDGTLVLDAGPTDVGARRLRVRVGQAGSGDLLLVTLDAGVRIPRSSWPDWTARCNDWNRTRLMPCAHLRALLDDPFQHEAPVALDAVLDVGAGTTVEIIRRFLRAALDGGRVFWASAAPTVPGDDLAC